MATNKILSDVVATEWSHFNLFLDYMPNPDIFFEQTGETIEVYNRMLMDDEIGASLDIRKRAILSYPWTLTAEKDAISQKIKDFVKEVLQSFSFSRLLEQMLTALEFGFSVNEVVWHDPKEKDGRWMIKDVILLKPERFSFKPDGTLVMLSPVHEEMGEKYRYKFIVHRNGVAPENPYGLSVLRRCYWPWTFKRAGWRFWLIAAEKFGVPTVLALFKADNEEQAKERAEMLAQMLTSIKTDAGLALANVDEVKTLEAKGEGLRSFEILIELCNRAISKAITGQFLATGEAKHGTRAQATVHENILYEIIDADARNLAETINNTLIPWIVELNFGKDAPVPYFEFDLSEETPWERIREAIDRGVPISQKALYEVYGLPRPEDERDVFISPKLGGMIFADRKEFAENDDFFVLQPRRWTFRFI